MTKSKTKKTASKKRRAVAAIDAKVRTKYKAKAAAQTAARAARKAPKRKRMIRIAFLPAKPPKWWPRDAAGKPAIVGITADGYGWVVGEGDVLDARHEQAAKDNVIFDHGPRTKFFVTEVSTTQQKGSK